MDLGNGRKKGLGAERTKVCSGDFGRGLCGATAPGPKVFTY